MSRLPEINDLFARLATNLQTLDPTARNEDQTHDLLISNLNQSLNLGEPRVGVLDTALSLMCFTAPQVFDSLTKYLVKTIVTVLSSTINCKVLRFGREEVLQIGCLISSDDFAEVIEACADVLVKLEGHGFCNFEGTLSHSLLYAVVRVAASMSRYQHVSQITLVLDVKSIVKTGPDLSKLLRHLPKEILLKSQEIPLRLLFWYLDPLILKDDVSQMLQEAIRRPFLCLNAELYERIEWRSVIICLVISPAMFIETRALLHNWFLSTGLASILELQSELASLVLDVISRPMWWGLSAELGSKLPFSHAYFPYNHHLLRTLAGPLSREAFLHLIDSINDSLSQARRQFGPALNQAETKISSTDHKSMWAMVMNFPDWLYYASVLLFSDRFHFKCAFGSVETDQSRNGESCSAAARYIAWILYPISESHQGLLADNLNKISRSFSLEKSDPDKNNKATSGYKKKLKIPKSSYKEDYRSDGCETIRLWLKDFQDMYITYYNRIREETHTSNGFGIKRNVLFRRIPLGILIGFCEHIDEQGCEMLLQYAATGTICQSKSESSTWTRNCNRKEALEGACIAFNVTDVAERMADLIFKTGESSVDFISQVKLRVGNYLIKCLERLLELRIDQSVGIVMLSDLHNRLVRWKRQGKDVFMGNKELDDAINAMRSKLSSL